MMRCPSCQTPQSSVDAIARLRFGLDMRPAIWTCSHCGASLACTGKGILLFWGVCFPGAMAAAFILVGGDPSDVSLVMPLIPAVGLLLTVLFSIPLRRTIYAIQRIDSQSAGRPGTC